MDLSKNSYFKLAVLMTLLIPIFFGYRVEYVILFPPPIYLWDFIIILTGIAGLLIVTYILIIPIFDQEELKLMKNHLAVHAFIIKDYKPILIDFSIIIILEELIFRFYIISILDSFFILLEWYGVILVGSIIFSFYHIHVWFTFKNLKIIYTYLIVSFFLGLLNGFVFYKLGLIVCIIIHYGVVLAIYWMFFKKIT